MVSFVQALRDKYDPPEVEADTSLQLGGGRVAVETVGWSKVATKLSRLSQLREVGLAAQGITCATAPGDEPLSAVCPNITDLDLSGNPLGGWREVAAIVAGLPRLQILRLNALPAAEFDFAFPKSLDGVAANPFASLKGLSLASNPTLEWSALAPLFPLCEGLEDLFLSRTRATSLAKLQLPPRLQMLGLESNALSAWGEQVQPLASMRSLTTLMLQGNELADIQPASASGSARDWPALTTLNLTSNKIATWKAVHALNSFPQLRELRLRDNPVLSGIPAENVQGILTARVGKITTLQGTKVSERDRLDAELHYLRHAASQIATLTNAQFSAAHPRYDDLVAIHGEPVTSPRGGAGADSGPGSTLKDKLVGLTLVWAAGNKRLNKRLPLSISVRTLRTMVHKLFAMPSAEFALKIRYRESGFEAECDDDTRELSYFALSENDEVHITQM